MFDIVCLCAGWIQATRNYSIDGCHVFHFTFVYVAVIWKITLNRHDNSMVE